MFLTSLGKNPIITFQHIVIQVFWEKTRPLLLLMALFSGFKNLARDGRLFNMFWKSENAGQICTVLFIQFMFAVGVYLVFSIEI